jgi:phosphoribosylanthranilate isomerase
MTEDAPHANLLPGGVKICGIRTLKDAEACVEAGASALGLNFWSGTPRQVDLATARAIAEALSDAVELVAVFVDASLEEIRHVREITKIPWVQLHGSEPAELVSALGPRAYKAVGVADAVDVRGALAFPGPKLLLDARVPGAMPGGTGHAFDWSLAIEVARERELILAGGLHPGNVAEAVRRVHPWRVDVASGVESAPGVKDHALVRAFVRAAREA